jgi:hypothetical protein
LPYTKFNFKKIGESDKPFHSRPVVLNHKLRISSELLGKSMAFNQLKEEGTVVYPMKALDKSIAHKLNMLPPQTKRLTVMLLSVATT